MKRPTALPPWRLRFALAVVCLGSLLGPLDSAVNVAFPPITAAFDIALPDIRWIIVGFLIAQSSLTIVFGKLGDLYGHRRIFQIGLAACALAHLACGFAPSYASLIALRVVQGMAVAVAMASAPALATLLFAPEHKRRVLAIYLMAFSIGIASGPIVGGALIAWFGWPAVFWFRTPLALLALVLSFSIPVAPIARAAAPRIDVFGATLLVIALATSILVVSVGAHDWMITIALALVCASSGVALVRHEARHPDPILPVRALRQFAFARLQGAAVLTQLCCFSIMLLGPYWIAARPEYTPWRLGLLLALFPLGSVVANALAGVVAGRAEVVRLVRAGIATCACGLAGMGGVILGDPIVGDVALPLVAGSLFLAGLGLGVFQLGYADATTSALPIAERGVAGSLINVTRLIGFVFGAALISALYQWLQALTDATAAFGWSFTLLAAALGAMVWVVPRHDRSR